MKAITSELLLETVQEFVQAHLIPNISAMEAGDKQVLWACWQAAARAGLTGITFPKAQGGLALDSISYLQVLSLIARYSASFATTLSVHVSVGTQPLFRFGTAEQKQRFLKDLVMGQKLAAFGLTEPDAGSDAGHGQCRAEPVEGGYRLNGSKLFITNAQLATFFMVTARTRPEISGPKGLSAFIVERNQPGFTVEPGEAKMGLCGSDWGELRFVDCVIPETNLMGVEGKGFVIFMDSLDSGRASIAAISLGIAEACYQASREFIQQSSGKSHAQPMAQQAALKTQSDQVILADMKTRIEAARHLILHTGALKDAGKPYSFEASAAKVFASETCNACAHETMKLLGEHGYTKASPVERYFRDAKAMEIVEGTSQIQRVILARQLLC